MTADRLNPFDDEQGIFLVLHNVKGQLSLWPDFARVPAGWSIAFGPDSRPACTAFVEESWAGALRPSAVSAA